MATRISSLVVIVLAAVSFAFQSDARPKKLPPVDTSKMQSLGLLGPSFYWVALETNDGEPKDQDVLDMDGNLLVKVGKKFFRGLTLEGTGRLLDGRLINWNGKYPRPNGTWEYRYRWVGPEAPYGYGFEGRPLIPFRTLAVDPTVVPLDSTLYIPAARGAVLPDGKIHDGYFKALDIGSAIQNRRIDVFTSFGDQSSVFDKNGLKHAQPTEVYLVK
ncbi:MAG: 3D domain-containing protein [Bdellovibrionota bacterium]